MIDYLIEREYLLIAPRKVSYNKVLNYTAKSSNEQIPGRYQCESNYR
jgi:hypothetical protein